MVTTLYVGNLPWTATEEELKQLFEQQTSIAAARIVKDKMSGRSRGFGFVEVDEKDAAKVISAFNGFKMKERELVVNEARPKQARQRI